MLNNNNEWHLTDPEISAQILGSDLYSGLDGREAKKRLKKNGKNDIWLIDRLNAQNYLKHCFGDLTPAALIIASLASSLFAYNVVAVTCCVILLIGYFLRSIIYIKSRNTFENMAREEIPVSTVIRDGRIVYVRSDSITEGDVIILSSGDIVPCDGRMFGGEVRVVEKGITENKDTVVKTDTILVSEDENGTEIPCEYRVNMLYAGSLVISGSCRLLATGCGEKSLVYMRHGGIKISSSHQSDIMSRLEKRSTKSSIVTTLAIPTFCLIAVIAGLLKISSFSLSDAFICSLALSASALSNCQTLIGYVVFAVPFGNLASGRKGRSVLKKITDIEKVSTVKNMLVTNSDMLKTGRCSIAAYYSDGEYRDFKKNDKNAVRLLLKMMFSSGIAIKTSNALNGSEEKLMSNDRMLKRISGYYNIDDLSKKTDTLLMDTTVVENNDGEMRMSLLLSEGDIKAYAVGGLTNILSCCDSISVGQTSRRLTDEMRRNIISGYEEALSKGYRVLALSHRSSPYAELKKVSVLMSRMYFDGFICFDEEVEETVSDILKKESFVPKTVLFSQSGKEDLAKFRKIGIFDEKSKVFDYEKFFNIRELPESSFIITVPADSVIKEKVSRNEKIRIAVARKLSELCDGNLAIMIDNPGESGMISGDELGFAVSADIGAPIPQTLKRKSCVSVYPGKKGGCGGFVETLKTIVSAKSALSNLRFVTDYSVILTSMRAFILLVCMLSGLTFINSAVIITLGLIFDYLSFIVLSFDNKGYGRVYELDRQNFRYTAKRAGIGSFIGALVVIPAVIASALKGGRIKDLSPEMLTCIMLSMVLLSAVMLIIMLHRKNASGPKSFFTVSTFLYALFSVLIFALLALPVGFSALFGGASPSWQLIVASLAGSVIVPAAYIISVKFQNRNK